MLAESRHTAKVWRFIVGLLLSLLCTAMYIAAAASNHPTIVFMTDFGTADDSVAICKGVMYSIAPDVRIVDLTHQVTPFSIFDGARFLYGATPCGGSNGWQHPESNSSEVETWTILCPAR
jgi:hypothetical protein